MLDHASQVVDFQGYLLGNPVTEPSFDDNSKVPFAHRMALIPDEMFKVDTKFFFPVISGSFWLSVILEYPGSQSVKRSCRGDYIAQHGRDPRCLEDIQDISKVGDNY